MEITVTRTQNGQQVLDELTAIYGSLEALERQAGRKGNHQAQEDWLTAQDLLASERRRNARWTRSATHRLEPKEVRLLTPARLELLERLNQSGRAEVNVRALADSVGRDKKNVSEDLAILRELGLVRFRREGREAFPMPAGNRITIDFEAPA